MTRLAVTAALAAVVVAASAMLLHSGRAIDLAGAASPTLERGVVDVNTALAFQNGNAAGTGIVLTPSGLVLTNNHVIRGATNIRVRVVGTGRSYGATVLGYSVANDVALLRLRGASNLQTTTLGRSSQLRVGMSVTAVGNAGGVGGDPTVTTGRVTELHRAITVGDGAGSSKRLTDLIRASTSVQPGDSGGPLLNGAGRVVGVITATAGGEDFNGQSSGAFAIPIDRAVSLADQIEAGRSSAAVHIGPTAFLGVLTRPDDDAGTRGAVIGAVVPGSAAAKAGIQAGDVVTWFGGHPVSSAVALTKLVLRVSPGAKVQIRWLDPDGYPHAAVVRPAAGPPQ